MACHLVASDFSVIYDNISRTAESTLWCHYPRLQARRRSDDLKSGTRLVGIIDTAVSPHLIQKILLFRVRYITVRSLRQFVRVIQIEFRHIDHGQYFTVLRIHDQDRDTLCLLGSHSLLGQLGSIGLYVHVQADIQVLPIYRLYPALAFLFYLDTGCIRYRQDRA